MGFDSGRIEQIADFSQCRLLLEGVDRGQNCHTLCYKEGANPLHKEKGVVWLMRTFKPNSMRLTGELRC